MSSELKPLYALLRRLKISSYLKDNEFLNTLIELDLDEDWRDILANQAPSHDDNDAYCEAFFRLMKMLDGRYSFSTENQEKLVKILLGFISWTPGRIDYKLVYQEVKRLGFERSVLKRFTDQSRAIDSVAARERDIAKASSIGRNPRKVFVIHGHDHVALLELEKLLKEEFDLIPVILKDSPSVGLSTVISKFEHTVSDCDITIALFTPDDTTADNNLRARQNVILELGYVLGRDAGSVHRKIIVIKKGKVEIPSDISGIIYFEFAKSVHELYLPLKKQFELWFKTPQAP